MRWLLKGLLSLGICLGSASYLYYQLILPEIEARRTRIWLRRERLKMWKEHKSELPLKH